MLLALIICCIPFYVLVKSQKKNKKYRKYHKKGGPLIEFKKIVVVAVLSTYFIGAAFGAYIVLKYDYTQLSPLLAYIGTPTTGAILSYCYVIRTENAIKLKQKYPEETEGYTVDINNTHV